VSTEPAPQRVVFEDLPSYGGHGTDFGLGDVLPILKARPDTWARVSVKDSKAHRLRHIAFVVNKGKNKWFGANFAASVRKRPDGSYALYMRYVGDEDSATE
jgi:hypothetical protein